MDNIFVNIGRIILSDIKSRINYHPMVIKYNITEIKKPTKSEPKTEGKNTKILKTDIKVFHINANMDDDTINIVNDDKLNPEDITYIKYVNCGADKKYEYLIGNYVFNINYKNLQEYIDKKNSKINKNKKIEFNPTHKEKKIIEDNQEIIIKQFSLKYFKENKYKGLFKNDSFIYKYRILFDKLDIRTIIENLRNNDETIKEIVFIVKITYNNETKEAHEFIECLDDIDKIFIKNNYIPNKGYTFKDAFYNMFSYKKYTNKGGSLKPIDSIPYYTEEELLSLYYAKKIYEKINHKICNDYSVSIFPNYENLNIDDINDIMSIKDIYNFENFCNVIENIISKNVSRNIKTKSLIPLFLTFDLYYRYDSHGIQNILRLNGIRYAQILKLKNIIINNPYYPIEIYGRKFSIEESLKYLFQDYNYNYKNNDNNSDNSDNKYQPLIINKYKNLILEILKNIYQNNFIIPPQAEKNIIENTEMYIRNTKPDDIFVKYYWINSFKILKFFKTMENKNYVSELENSKSYQLGYELAEIESSWKKGRENIVNFSKNFAGNITRKVNTINNVRDYYIQLIERMTINGITIYQSKKFNELYNMNDSEFKKNEFISGYYMKKYTFNSSNKSIDESTDESTNNTI